MAKKSKIVKNERRRAIVARYAERRAELKKDHPLTGEHPRATGGGAGRVGAPAPRRQRGAGAQPRRRRRPTRGHLRKFGLSRVRVRELAHAGQLPGVRKASW